MDLRALPDFTFAPPTHQNPFTGNNPIAVTYDQQRKVYAGSNSSPATFWMSKPGQFKKIYQRVKEMADLLGTARDTDVMLQGLQEKAEQVASEERAGVKWLIERLKVYRKQRQEQLEEFFTTFDEDDFKQQVVTCIKKGALSNGEG